MSKVKYIPPERPGNKSEYDIIVVKDCPKESTEASQLLKNTLQEVGFNLDNVYITNVVKVILPDNESPTNEELESWKPVLMKELSEIKAKYVVCVGQAACTSLGINQKISSIRGKHQVSNGTNLFFLFHPGYVLKNPKMLSLFKKDLETLKGLI